MKNMKRIALVVAITLLLGCAIGGTLAWLTDSTEAVTNTFTSSDVDIDLAETTTDYKMVPGNVIPKDPKVTVKADSEPCWLFVKIEKSANYDTYLESYQVAEGWTKGDGTLIPANVYYRTAVANDNFYVLKGNTTNSETTDDNGYVIVKTGVTKAEMALIDGKDADGNALTGDALKAEENARPTLTFKAFAVQQANIVNNNDNGTAADEAWATIPANVK